MNIEIADTSVATVVEAAATRKMAGSRAEPDPVPLLNGEDIKTELPEKRDMPRCSDPVSTIISQQRQDRGIVVPGFRGEEKIKVELKRKACPSLRLTAYRPAGPP